MEEYTSSEWPGRYVGGGGFKKGIQVTRGGECREMLLVDVSRETPCTRARQRSMRGWWGREEQCGGGCFGGRGWITVSALEALVAVTSWLDAFSFATRDVADMTRRVRLWFCECEGGHSIGQFPHLLRGMYMQLWLQNKEIPQYCFRYWHCLSYTIPLFKVKLSIFIHNYIQYNRI